jgi:hypothetical protein
MQIRAVLFPLITIALPIAALEGVFRLLPVSDPPPIMPVSAADPVVRFAANVDYVYSKGWNFSIVAWKRSNNYGYINQRDYDRRECDYLLVVIGDSFVEGYQIQAGRTAAELLDRRTGPRDCVYSIGISGAALSQYLVFAEFARTTFRPDAMAFVIVGNDFDESLLKYKSSPRLHYFREDGGSLVLQRVDYRMSGLKSVLRKSALIRYIVHNLDLEASLHRLVNRDQQDSEFVGNVAARVSAERLADSRRAIDEFVRQIPTRTGLGSDSVLLVMDGMRPALYSTDSLRRAEGSYFAEMRRHLAVQARASGYTLIDMQPVFAARHRLDQSRFEFAIDAHWNELAHRLVADSIADWLGQRRQ